MNDHKVDQFPQPSNKIVLEEIKQWLFSEAKKTTLTLKRVSFLFNLCIRTVKEELGS